MQSYGRRHYPKEVFREVKLQDLGTNHARRRAKRSDVLAETNPDLYFLKEILFCSLALSYTGGLA